MPQDKCIICDYSEAQGSSLIGVNPGDFGRVFPRKEWGNELICDECYYIIRTEIYDPDDMKEENDEESEDSLPVPGSEELWVE